MWFVFQGSIVFAFIASNIAWQWTPNRLIPPLFGFAIAWLLTAAWNRLRALH
jgi:hypothetical protein